MIGTEQKVMGTFHPDFLVLMQVGARPLELVEVVSIYIPWRIWLMNHPLAVAGKYCLTGKIPLPVTQKSQWCGGEKDLQNKFTSN